MTDPRVDLRVALQALKSGTITLAEYVRLAPARDPYTGLTDDERVELVIRSCASGAPAELPTADGRARRPPSPTTARPSSSRPARTLTERTWPAHTHRRQ